MASIPKSRFLSKEKLMGWVTHFLDFSKYVSSFNTLTASIQSLQEELSSGRFKSNQGVEGC